MVSILSDYSHFDLRLLDNTVQVPGFPGLIIDASIDVDIGTEIHRYGTQAGWFLITSDRQTTTAMAIM